MDQKLQLEDTVSADRKERIIYVGPGKTRKISSITSRQNFNNEKFTRKANKGDEEDDEKEQVEESAMQTTGTSTIDNGAPTQSDTISQDKPKKSNNPQIEFVTGTEKAGSASTAIGNAQNMGIKKISEAIVKKALANVKVDKNVGTDEVPFDVDTSAEKEFKKPHNPNRSPMDTVRALAQKAMKKQTNEEVENIQEGGMIPGLETHGGATLGKSDLANHFKKTSGGSGENPFKKKYKPAKPNVPAGTVTKTTNESKLDDIRDHARSKLSSMSATDRLAHHTARHDARMDQDEADRRKRAQDEHDFKMKEKEHNLKHGLTHAAQSAKINQAMMDLTKKKFGESVEQIDELSVGALKSYIKGAKASKNLEADAVRTAEYKGNHAWASDATQIVNKRKDGIKAAKAKLNKEGQDMKSYQEFLNQLLEYTPGPGGVTRVQGRSYGAQYHDPEGDDDADDRAPAAKPADAPKRGRGRPAGSKSGANQKVTSGKSYGGIATHSLHLPNSK